jgi:outer membrane lipopolysaccharide assembly protein LptE/RlpB
MSAGSQVSGCRLPGRVGVAPYSSLVTRHWLLLGLIFLSGCGYNLVGRGNFLPPTVRTIQVPAFVNRTTRVEVEQQVTQAVADEVVLRGRLKLVTNPDDADVILHGQIDTFGITPVAFNQQGRATQYQVSITAQIELRDHRAEDKVLWKNNQYRFLESYPVDLGASGAFDEETRAISEIAQRFAERLVSNLLEGF